MNAETYRKRKQDGVCTICGGTTVYTEVGFGSKTRCLRCAANDVYYRERKYQRCANRGICVRCGKRPARENRMTCAACAKRQQATYLKRLWGTELNNKEADSR